MQFRKLGDLSVPVIGMGTYVSFDVGSGSDIDVRHKIIDEGAVITLVIPA